MIKGIFIFLFILFNLNTFASKSDSLKVKYKSVLDSLYSALELDTTSAVNVALCNKMQDMLSIFPQFKQPQECLDILYFHPLPIELFSIIPLESLINLKSYDERDYFNFLEEFDIVSYLHKIYFDRNNQVVKIEQISIDINVNFGELISTAFYKNGFLTLFINDYCFKMNEVVDIRIFNIEKYELTKEVLISYKNKNFSYQSWTK
jgi:hypothetical protein